MNGLFEMILEIVLEGSAAAMGFKRAALPVRIALGLFLAALAAVALAAAVLLLWVGMNSGTIWLCGLGAMLLVGFLLGCALRARGVRARHRENQRGAEESGGAP